MQIHCYNCHKPFSLSRETIYAALEEIEEEQLSHFDVPCPHCRRVNRVSPKDLRRVAPEWRKTE
jgi:phage FluMu protein Com